MTDRPSRSAALLSALVAIPVAIAAGAVAFALLHGHLHTKPTAANVPTVSTTSTDAVPMPTPSLSAGDAQACLAFIAQLPVKLSDLDERRVSAGSEQNIAYGDPAITAECGAQPASVPDDGEVWVVNNVCWFEADTATAAVLTTVDRQVPVAVTVPKSYSAPLQWLPTFANSLVETMPLTKAHIPTGCTTPTG